jgi:ATP-dependent DNA helicase RecQ
VTAVPSLRHPELVPNFAARLAEALELPFKMTLVKTDNRQNKKPWPTASSRHGTLMARLLSARRNPAGPVLLVDDMVDSRWTLTVSAWLLRQHGSGVVVWPLVLGQTGHET